MTDAEVFAYYKKTAAIEDVRFALKYDLPMTDELRDEWIGLLKATTAGLPKTESRRQLDRLQVQRFDWIRTRNGHPMLPVWEKPADSAADEDTDDTVNVSDAMVYA